MGTPRVFRVDGREVSVRAAFQAPYADALVATVGVMRSLPAVLVKGPDWDAAGLRVGSHVTVNGTEHAVVSVERDDSDLVVAALRESR